MIRSSYAQQQAHVAADARACTGFGQTAMWCSMANGNTPNTKATKPTARHLGQVTT